MTADVTGIRVTDNIPISPEESPEMLGQLLGLLLFAGDSPICGQPERVLEALARSNNRSQNWARGCIDVRDLLVEFPLASPDFANLG